MLTKDYINKCREIIWTLLIKNNIRKFIENKFFVWKKNLCKDEKIKNANDSLTSNFDEERIIEFLKDAIINNFGYDYDYEYEFLDKYYSIIYSLLSLSDEYEIISKKNFNENDNIRELLIIPKDNLETNILNNNKSDIIYIMVKNLQKKKKKKEIFDGIELKKKYDKIIKFGIAFNEENCDVIYEINYGNCFLKKKKEIQKEIYTEENYRDAIDSNCYLIDKTKMISKYF
ncbi:hypothetical protein U3516DRAFT_805248 [Neocallimastix sp. 'constans']